MKIPRVILIGTGGYSLVHLRHLLDFHASGELAFVAAVALPEERDSDAVRSLAEIGCTLFTDVSSAAAATAKLGLDLAVVPTPIHCHAPMTLTLLAAGLHVLVEKPIAASLDDIAQIAEAAARADRIVAVGFQYLHAPEIRALKQHLLESRIGPLRRIVTHAAWPRSHAYYARNSWAGRLRVDERWVLDSPVNNAMSHFVMLMLFLAGRSPHEAAHPRRLTAELYRAQAIESFDTAALHIETSEGVRLEYYGTHSSENTDRPSLRIEGESGGAEWVQDSHASFLREGQPIWTHDAQPESDTRERMLRDVLACIAGRDAFVCRPALAATHTRVVTALHEHVPITTVAPVHLERRIENGSVFTFIPGLDDALRVAAARGRFLREIGARWAATPVDAEISPLPLLLS